MIHPGPQHFIVYPHVPLKIAIDGVTPVKPIFRHPDLKLARKEIVLDSIGNALKWSANP